VPRDSADPGDSSRRPVEDQQRVVRRRRAEAAPSNRTWPKRLLIGGLAVVVVVGLVAVAGAAWGFWSFSQLRRENLNLAEAADAAPQNYLVIGSDSREGIKKGAGSGAMLDGPIPAGRRSDSIAIMRVDPAKSHIDMLSIPRDLWLPIAGTGHEQRINTAYGTSTQTLVDTIQQDLGIPVNHFVEVDFVGFQDLMQTIGGVPMYFDHPVRDRNSGLRVPQKGCTVLDGYQGLAFARSRHLEWNNGTRWVSDPTADLGRMTRQQILARAALSKVRKLGLNDIGKVKGLVDAGVNSVKLDDGIGVSEILDLARQFSDFDPQKLQTHSLPVVPHTTDGGAAVLLLDQAAAQPTLDLFRGAKATSVTTTTVPPASPSDVTVSVSNHTSKQGEARRVSYVLSSGGFGVGTVDSSTELAAATVVRYPAGSEGMGRLVAAWIGPEPQLKEDTQLPPGHVVVDIGSDFARVGEPAKTAGGTTSSTVVGAAATGSAAPATTTTTEPGWTPGTPPAGVTCH
jgi:LCP family protein required for cell wall assembly